MAQNVLEVTDSTFEAEVVQSTLPVVVDFWAPWCGPCRAMAPVLEQFAQEKAGEVKVAKVNVDEAAGVAGQYGVMSIPTFLVFKGGKPVGQIVGAMPKETFVARVEAALAS
ncbi:MAG: thioredoxin [Armatimonadetes bacterium]|jgi:thioredoxin 1|nr:thioredoxin [Armatimonadota bacterium]